MTYSSHEIDGVEYYIENDDEKKLVLKRQDGELVEVDLSGTGGGGGSGSPVVTEENRFVIEGSPAIAAEGSTSHNIPWGHIVLDGPDFTWSESDPTKIVVVNCGLYVASLSVAISSTEATSEDRRYCVVRFPRPSEDPSHGYWQGYGDVAPTQPYQQLWVYQEGWLEPGAEITCGVYIEQATGTSSIDYAFITLAKTVAMDES